MKGMTPIVRNVACLVAGFVIVYGLYVTLTGHVAPGGGFAGAAVVVAGALLLILALGLRRRPNPQSRYQPWTGAGALGFVLVAVGGFLKGGWFVNFVPKAGSGDFGHELLSSGTILLSDVFVCAMVSTGLVGVFLALIAGVGRPVLQQQECDD